ncbi:uncharacterized protein LOC108897799 isoform X2 [Lates calcarifer]|uniref:Uncharacterized protein LOC108897799 isoform X2 n=1 Tax=Lates calcarifer TaxID=8187 RepID=A0AAJ7QDK4_LATCA|nr:uncharacterized protein LOC108897799 isoform X2 [Lates calcarifer]
MAHNTLKCQVCLTNFKSVCRFKTHVRSKEHRQKMIKVFQKDTFLQHGTFPHITLLDPLAIKQPIIGLSLLTACFSLDRKTIFYLCHVCEEKCPTDKIANHLFSGDHYSSYFNYTDPNVLKFAWLPSMNMWLTHKSQVSKEVRDKGPVTLQMLNLPQTLMKRLETSLYSEVMDILNENEALLKMLKATKPKRTMIQSYQKDSNRKHPLLGMQHLIECICVGPPEKRFYLCTLCNLTLATHTVIKHVLSFDHIFCYLKAWHPSTLMSKQCYINYTDVFASMMLDFAKQTEEIHGTANTDMKQVSLEPAEFRLVNSFCYAKALEKLESITKENKGSSLMTSIKPGNKLERRTVSAAVSVASSYKLHCQECSTIFETESQYSQHLSKQKHKEMLKKCFREAVRADGYDQTVKPHLDLCTYLRESMKQNKPVIGVSLVVACVCSDFQSEPVYVCFACEDCFPEPHLRQHFKSHKHVIRTLLYQNPWRLPFAWKNHLDGKILTSNALEEEKERGPNQMMLKVLDIPYRIFEGLIPPSYPKVMERLEKHHMLLKQEVPKRETYSKLKQNERFPLLGKKFLVMHSCHQHTKVGFLCLLCERRLSDGENESHVFSREHVAAFLDRFHPGSVSPSTDAETLLDLAKQAARIHPIANEQVIELDKPIWEPCSYHTLTFILASAKRRHGGGNLEPEITPKMKLFPRETLKEVDKDTQKNSVMKEESESKTSQKSTDNNDSLPNKISVELGSEIINKCGAESEETAGKGADKESPTPSDKESETRREALSKTSPDEIKNADSEMCPLTKEEKMDELSTKKPSGETPENCQDTDKDDRAETGKEESKSSKDVPIQLKSCMYQENERKRPNDMSEKPQEGICSTSDKDMGGEMPLKRARLTSKEDASCEEPQKIPSGGPEGATTAADKGESDSHDTAKDEVSSKVTYQQAAHLWQYVKEKIREPVVGLSALLECHCDQHDPIYLCECCCLKIPEKDIINHVTGFDHQKQYLLVVDLCEEMYSNILKQNFNSAMQTVKALLAQQDSGCDLPSTSASSGVRPVQVSVTLHAQAEVQSAMDNIEVVEIVSDSEDSEAQPSSVTASMSVMTETTSKTTVPSESNVYIKMTGIKVPESGDNANTCLAVSRSGEDALSLHVPESGTNSQHKIAPNTTVEQSKKVITSKIEGASQTAAAPVSTVTTSTKPMIAVSGCTAISSSCTQNTTKSTAAVSKLTANTSSCTTAATKLSETADKSVAATSSGTTGTTQLTAANPSSSKTTTSAAPAPSCTTTTTKCRETTSKCSATTSSATRTTTKSTASTTIRTAATAKYTAATSKSTATTTTFQCDHIKYNLGHKVCSSVQTSIHSDAQRPP